MSDDLTKIAEQNKSLVTHAKLMNALPDVVFADTQGFERFVECTCDSCSDKYMCPYSYDLYNIDGDCLGMK